MPLSPQPALHNVTFVFGAYDFGPRGEFYQFFAKQDLAGLIKRYSEPRCAQMLAN